MQLSSSTVLQTVNNYVAQGNYPAAYQTVLNDLNSQNVTRSANDQDVLNWIGTAIAINSGATNNFQALLVRANNVAAAEEEQAYPSLCSVLSSKRHPMRWQKHSLLT
jgi:hypothetical protein